MAYGCTIARWQEDLAFFEHKTILDRLIVGFLAFSLLNTQFNFLPSRFSPFIKNSQAPKPQEAWENHSYRKK